MESIAFPLAGVGEEPRGASQLNEGCPVETVRREERKTFGLLDSSTRNTRFREDGILIGVTAREGAGKY